MKKLEARKEFINYCIKNHGDPDSLIDTNSKSLVYMGKFEWLYDKIKALEKERDELKEDRDGFKKSYDGLITKWGKTIDANVELGNFNLDLQQELQTLKDAVKELIPELDAILNIFLMYDDNSSYFDCFLEKKEIEELQKALGYKSAIDKLKELIKN